jgi:hypothetical protein
MHGPGADWGLWHIGRSRSGRWFSWSVDDDRSEDGIARPAGLSDQDILLEAAAIVRCFYADPADLIAEELTGLAFGESR